MSRLALTLFGGFEARLGAQTLALPLKKSRALLAYLALPAGRRHPREQLAALLWGDRPQDLAHNSLRQALFGLRTALRAARPQCLRAEGDGVVLTDSAVDTDVARFTDLAAAATDEALVRAAALYRGPLLDGLTVDEAAFDDWIADERERLRRSVAALLSTLLARQLAAGATEEATAPALRFVALEPVHEATHRTLMRLYLDRGERALALRQYETCARVLQRELGTEPEPETTRLYREIARRRPSSGAAAADPSRIAFIGRTKELATLEDQWRLARSGQGCCVVVLGEAGIGKTRLTEELVAFAGGHECQIVRGRAYESARILPFGVWTDALRGEPVARARELTRGNAGWCRELARLFPELALRTRAVSGAGDAPRLFEALAHVVQCLAASRPVLIVLEDLHWADDMSLSFLSFLARRLGSHSVLVVCTARIEEPGQALLTQVLTEIDRAGGLRRVALEGLTRSETESLVGATMARAGARMSAAGLVDRVWTMSDGNPFVATEAIHTLANDGGGELALPSRVREMILSRVERLSAPARHLVAVAAVVGREFTFALLRRAAALDEPSAVDSLDELVHAHVVRERGDRFDFTHDRIREAVYGDLLVAKRRLLHAAVGEALEELPRGDLDADIGALAVHFQAAEQWDKAVTHLRTAGAQAAARGAYRAAVSLFEAALAALAALPESTATIELGIDLRIDLRDWLMPMGEASRLRACLEEAEALARRLGDERRLALVSGHLAHYFWMMGVPDRALELAERLVKVAEARDDVTLIVLGNFYLGEVCHALGDHRRAVSLLRRNAELLQGASALERFAGPGLVPLQSRFWLAFSLAELGDLDDAFRIAEEAHALAGVVEHPFSLASAKSAVGRLHLERGANDTAIPWLEQALALMDSRGIAMSRAGTVSLLGSAYVRSGRHADGMRLLAAAVDHAAGFRRMGSAMVVGRLAEGQMVVGKAARPSRPRAKPCRSLASSASAVTKPGAS
jgi:DNA-binding SARP family transcriptional activator